MQTGRLPAGVAPIMRSAPGKIAWSYDFLLLAVEADAMQVLAMHFETPNEKGRTYTAPKQ